MISASKTTRSQPTLNGTKCEIRCGSLLRPRVLLYSVTNTFRIPCHVFFFLMERNSVPRAGMPPRMCIRTSRIHRNSSTRVAYLSRGRPQRSHETIRTFVTGIVTVATVRSGEISIPEHRTEWEIQFPTWASIGGRVHCSGSARRVKCGSTQFGSSSSSALPAIDMLV